MASQPLNSLPRLATRMRTIGQSLWVVSQKLYAAAEHWGKRQTLRKSLLHLFVLNALAITQPLLSQLADNPRFMLEMGLTTSGLLGITLTLLLLVPSLQALTVIVARRIDPKAYACLMGCWAGGYFLILSGQIFRRGLQSDLLRQLGLLDFFQCGLMLALTTAAMTAYLFTLWFPRVVTYAGVGLIVFPVMFLANANVLAVLRPRQPLPSVTITRPVPIVLIIFDGLQGTALMNEDRQIDAIRYPNFARLAESAAWFRNATTVHPRTDHAVPAILSGRVPKDGTPPVLAAYPQNLLSLLQDSRQYTITSFEPFTRLTPPELELHPRHLSPWQQTVFVTWTLQKVLWKISLPANIAGNLPYLPREWFSLADDFEVNRALRNGCIRYGWDRDRFVQISHFVDCLERADRPQFWLAHLALPHQPFLYYANGIAYAAELRIDDKLPGTHGALAEDWGPDELAVDQAWQRYLLQVGAADQALGKILDKLQATGLYEDSLIVVTSDHGYSFRPNQPQRTPVPANLPDLLPIPLIVKRPDTATRLVSDRNVESIDILPTIAAEIGLQLPPTVEGESVFAETRARLRKTLQTPDGLILAEGAFPRADESRKRMLRRFGSGRDDRLWTVDLRPEWHGRSINEFTISSTPGPRVHLHYPIKRQPLHPDDNYVRGLFSGEIVMSKRDTQSPILLALSVHGQIRCVTRTYTDPAFIHFWSALLPYDPTFTTLDGLELWQVVDENGQSRLRRCQFSHDLHQLLLHQQ